MKLSNRIAINPARSTTQLASAAVGARSLLGTSYVFGSSQTDWQTNPWEFPGGANITGTLDYGPIPDVGNSNDDTEALRKAFAGNVPEKVTVYAIAKALCIEPFISIDLAPGETKTWSSRYVFESIEGE